MKSELLSAERLRALLAYDRHTGVFTRLVTVSSNGKAGSSPGCLDKDGYLTIGLCGKTYKAHRLAWLHVTGAWPKGVIDHIDCNPANNAFANLRDVTAAENRENQHTPRADNRTGILGVCTTRKGFGAYIRVRGGKAKFLGVYATPEEAGAAYLAAKRRLHEAFSG